MIQESSKRETISVRKSENKSSKRRQQQNNGKRDNELT